MNLHSRKSLGHNIIWCVWSAMLVSVGAVSPARGDAEITPVSSQASEEIASQKASHPEGYSLLGGGPTPATPPLAERVVACPQFVDESTPPTRVVMQVIEDTFHKWREYELGNGAFCIVQVEPEFGRLSQEEAESLLEASAGWMVQNKTPSPDEWELLGPDDPRLKLPPVERKVPDEFLLQRKRNGEKPDEEIRSRLLGEAMAPKGAGGSGDSGEGSKFVIGDDERNRVYNNESYPWNTIGYVIVLFGDSYYRATGFLVSRYAVFTSSHNIYDTSQGRFVDGFWFTPGQFQATPGGPVSQPYGWRGAVTVNTNVAFADTGYADYDYGAAFLDTAFPGITTFMPLQFNFEPSHVHLAGYPAAVREETDSVTMWHSEGEAGVLPDWDEILIYLADASPGTSGAPVWTWDGTTRRVQAIHSSGVDLPEEGLKFNLGPRFTSLNQSLIQDWMQWSPELTISPTSRNHGPEASSSHQISVTSNICWEVTSGNDGWITIISESSDCGDRTVQYSVSENTSTSSRNGSITVSGGDISRTFAVNQSASGETPTRGELLWLVY